MKLCSYSSFVYFKPIPSLSSLYPKPTFTLTNPRLTIHRLPVHHPTYIDALIHPRSAPTAVSSHEFKFATKEREHAWVENKRETIRRENRLQMALKTRSMLTENMNNRVIKRNRQISESLVHRRFIFLIHIRLIKLTLLLILLLLLQLLILLLLLLILLLLLLLILLFLLLLLLLLLLPFLISFP